MSKPAFTHDQVMTTLREIVAEKPDFVYNAPDHMRHADRGIECFYVHVDSNGENPEPGCLVGAVLHKLGVPLEKLGTQETFSAGVAVPTLVDVPMGTAKVLRRAQRTQDEGESWGAALSDAETMLAYDLAQEESELVAA